MEYSAKIKIEVTIAAEKKNRSRTIFMNLLLDRLNLMVVEEKWHPRIVLMPDVHGSSVGEAPAQHKGRCRTASKDVGSYGEQELPD